MSRLAIIAELAQRRAVALREEQLARIVAIRDGVRRCKKRREPSHRTGSRRYRYADGVAYAEGMLERNRRFAKKRRDERKSAGLCQRCGAPCVGSFCETHQAEHRAKVHVARRLKRLQRRSGIRAMSRGQMKILDRKIARAAKRAGRRVEITLCD